ncbi:hypothetical protein ACIBG0_41715 [Nocardia sp. NPDC050630]|uniref:hypothetical protein n=1 Tax=Nocardia sp. NPDC050630 TaxID=3364321 RepID=UPI0037BCBB8B
MSQSRKIAGYVPLEPMDDFPEWEAKTGGTKMTERLAQMLAEQDRRAAGQQAEQG